MLGQQGQFDEAVTLYSDSLDALKMELGALHPETIGILEDLANLHHQRGDQDAFERWQEDVIAAKERFWGIDHPQAAAARAQLESPIQDENAK